jgi:hypothetical protein
MRRYCHVLPVFLFLLLINTSSLFSQSKDSAKLKISGYVDAYYALYNDSLARGSFQKFPTISPVSNNFGINIAQVQFKYDGKNVRGQVILQYGDIPRSAWAGDFNMIQKAHVGVRLSKKVWVDAGFFRTHFGTEGLLPKENICSSISINTFYEPYFESGARVEYNPNSKWALALYVLNGYNMFTENNKKKSIGVLINYNPNERINVGYSNYLGDDTPDPSTTSHFRIHQNIFFNYNKNKVTLQAGGDFCLQQNSQIAHPEKWANMFSGVASVKYNFAGDFSVYGRGEFFNDPDGFMSTIITDKTGKLTGYKVAGVTTGLEYTPTDNSYIRLEGRQLMMNTDQEIFYRSGMVKSTRGEVMLNMGISF